MDIFDHLFDFFDHIFEFTLTHADHVLDYALRTEILSGLTILFLLILVLNRRKGHSFSDPELERIARELKKDRKVTVDFTLLAEKLWLAEDRERLYHLISELEKMREREAAEARDKTENESKPRSSEDTTSVSTDSAPPKAPAGTTPTEEGGLQNSEEGRRTPEKRPVGSDTPLEKERYLRERHERMAAFFDRYISPYSEKLKREGIYDAVLDVLAVLVEARDISSVAGTSLRDSSLGFNILRKVSLLEHSLNVAEIGFELCIKELPYSIETSPGKYLLIFLGHDLGKAFAGEHYFTADHPVLSARILSEIIPDSYPHKETIVAVVERHHLQQVSQPKSVLEYDLWLLQNADRMAREREISTADLSKVLRTSPRKPTPESSEDRTEGSSSTSFSPTASSMAPPPTGSSASSTQTTGESNRNLELENNFVFPKGITVEELLERLLPFVNHSVTEEDLQNPDLPLPPNTQVGNFLAVSQPDGIVYVRPDLIHEIFSRLIVDRNLVEENRGLVARMARDKNEALPHIAAWLMAKDVIVPGHVKPGYYGRWYAFKIGNSEYRALFTPLRASAFGVLPGRLEEKRLANPKTAKIHSFRKASKPK